MIKIYGMPSCPDCQVIAPQVMQHLDKYQPNDIGSDVHVMKEFLRLRDTSPRKTAASGSRVLYLKMAR